MYISGCICVCIQIDRSVALTGTLKQYNLKKENKRKKEKRGGSDRKQCNSRILTNSDNTINKNSRWSLFYYFFCSLVILVVSVLVKLEHFLLSVLMCHMTKSSDCLLYCTD